MLRVARPCLRTRGSSGSSPRGTKHTLCRSSASGGRLFFTPTSLASICCQGWFPGRTEQGGDSDEVPGACTVVRELRQPEDWSLPILGPEDWSQITSMEGLCSSCLSHHLKSTKVRAWALKSENPALRSWPWAVYLTLLSPSFPFVKWRQYFSHRLVQRIKFDYCAWCVEILKRKLVCYWCQFSCGAVTDGATT